MSGASWPPMIAAEIRTLQRSFDAEALLNKDFLLDMKKRLGA